VVTDELHRVRIVIADRHTIFRDGLRHLLEGRGRFTVVGESKQITAAVGVARETRADLLLLGMAGDAAQSLDVLRQLGELGLATRTIVLVDRVDTPAVRTAIQLGAAAVVPKDSNPEVLVEAIHAVLAGESSDAVEQLRIALSRWRRLADDRRRDRAFGLTRRELDILRAVVEGYTNREIAARASITENTVKTHLCSLFDKLGASNRVELALFAAHHRVFDAC